MSEFPASERPLILTVPGLDGSGPKHWQSLWERDRSDCVRVELGSWAMPRRNNWVTQLDIAIANASRPVVLVAHSLGCLAVAWWVHLARPAVDGLVRGAMLVAPPEVDGVMRDPRLGSFAPVPKSLLPFTSVVVASRNDPFISQDRARRLASFWGSRFVDAGAVGHINAQSGVRDWPLGQLVLSGLIDDARKQTGPAQLLAGHQPSLAELSAA